VLGFTPTLGQSGVATAPVELGSFLGNFGWHPRRIGSKLKTPCWKNPTKIV